MEQRATTNAQTLNWQTSIVDLLKLLDIDSSLEARKSWLPNSTAPCAIERLGRHEHAAAQRGAQAHRCQRWQRAH
jgi:hypothetical protein